MDQQTECAPGAPETLDDSQVLLNILQNLTALRSLVYIPPRKQERQHSRLCLEHLPRMNQLETLTISIPVVGHTHLLDLVRALPPSIKWLTLATFPSDELVYFTKEGTFLTDVAHLLASGNLKHIFVQVHDPGNNDGGLKKELKKVSKNLYKKYAVLFEVSNCWSPFSTTVVISSHPGRVGRKFSPFPSLKFVKFEPLVDKNARGRERGVVAGSSSTVWESRLEAYADQEEMEFETDHREHQAYVKLLDL
ncbi:hypothetical protein M011DRAFT_2683 [Sporormia fimetaria CBS 119925]|uniref:Uncharacterized protein n=1 Tax=Sporormia fimetaria CBS 119925 TaxID=1340428 RepID=A0A6A6VM73_9PLEO|nr:hypothetical protein M011DRAFT_2683 [Sporormia fimetaria CBS 119925]